jgi:hypothetical protein
MKKIRYYKYINFIQLYLQINSNSWGEFFGLTSRGNEINLCISIIQNLAITWQNFDPQCYRERFAFLSNPDAVVAGYELFCPHRNPN